MPLKIRRSLQLFAIALLASIAAREEVAFGVTQAVIWLPTGVAVAGLWLVGPGAWWVIALATLAHRVSLTYPASICVSAALGSSAEALVGYAVLKRLGLSGDFARLRDVFAVGVAAVLAPVASILTSFVARCLFADFRNFPFHSGWDGWWRMNALGLATVVPVALTWAKWRPVVPDARTLGACAALGAMLAAALGAVIWLVEPGPTAILLLWLVVPVALLAGVRFGVKGATTVSAVGVIGIALAATHAVGPFQFIALAERHVAVQVFELTLVAVPLVFGALIAEREADRVRLLHSEALRTALLRVLPDVTCRIGTDDVIRDVLVPNGVAQLLSAGDLRGRRLGDVLPPPLAVRMHDAVAAVLRGERVLPLEYRVDLADGAQDREARFLRFADDEALLLVRDISQRKRAERVLAWQATVLELVAKGAATGEIFTAVVRGLEALHPDGLCSILLLQGRRLVLACAPSLPAAYNAAADGFEVGADRASCGRAAHGNQTVVTHDIAEDPCWAPFRHLALPHGLRACWSVPIRDTEGTAIGTFAIYHRTPRSPAPEEIALVERAAVLTAIAIERERREGLLASILRNVQEGIYRGSPGRGLVHANQAMARMFGYATPEALLAVARGAGDSPHEQDLRRLAAGAVDAAAGETRLHRRDGTAFDALVSCAAVAGVDGQPAFCDGAITDVTVRRQLEEQLRQAQKMEAVGKLAGGVAHDFNNLLTVIVGYGEGLRDGLPAGSQQLGDVDEVLRAAQRASALTRQLLAFSRQQVLAPHVFGVAMAIEQLASMLRRVIGEDIRLVLQLAPDTGCVRVDRSQFEQVILNLVVNARDAMPAGGVLTIQTEVVAMAGDAARARDLAPGTYVAVAVCDSGHGMSREVQARAFDPFFTTKAPGKGTGLGLSTVYGIVKQSGGAVWLDSEAGRGTAVRIHLPRVADGQPSERPVPLLPPPRRRGSLLLVEDEERVRALVQRTLARAGYTVAVAVDGRAALELAAAIAEPIDLLVTDVVMPRLCGRELAAALRALRPGLPVLFLSGYASDGVRPVDTDAHTGFLQKPFTAADLLERVAALLAAARADSTPVE